MYSGALHDLDPIPHRYDQFVCLTGNEIAKLSHHSVAANRGNRPEPEACDNLTISSARIIVNHHYFFPK